MKELKKRKDGERRKVSEEINRRKLDRFKEDDGYERVLGKGDKWVKGVK